MKNNEINNPSHYTDGRAFQPKDVIRELHLNFNLGNVVKYISRAGRKPGESKYKDLSKAKTYLGFEIEYLKNNPQFPFIHLREHTFYFEAIAKDWGLTEEEKAIIKCIVTNRFNWPKLETAYKQLEDLINNCKKDHALEMFEESKKADSVDEVGVMIHFFDAEDIHFFDSEVKEIEKAREYYKFIHNESNCIKDALNNIDVNCSDIKERDFDKEFVSIEKAQKHIKNIIKVYEKKGNEDKEDEIKNLKEALNHLDNMKEINRAIAKLERLDNDETETI